MSMRRDALKGAASVLQIAHFDEYGQEPRRLVAAAAHPQRRGLALGHGLPVDAAHAVPRVVVGRAVAGAVAVRAFGPYIEGLAHGRFLELSLDSFLALFPTSPPRCAPRRSAAAPPPSDTTPAMARHRSGWWRSPRRSARRASRATDRCRCRCRPGPGSRRLLRRRGRRRQI